jgi:hypothetical protein
MHGRPDCLEDASMLSERYLGLTLSYQCTLRSYRELETTER